MRYLYLSLALVAALTSCSSGVVPAASTGGAKPPPSSTQVPVDETPSADPTSVNPAPTVPVNPAPTVPVNPAPTVPVNPAPTVPVNPAPVPSPNQLSAVGVWKGSFYSSRALNNPNPFTLTVTGQDSAGNFTGKVNNAALGPFSLNVTGKINGNQITLNYQTNMAVCDGAFTQENGKTRYQADCMTRDGNGPQSSNFLDMTRQ